jgi:hypothetical protein
MEQKWHAYIYVDLDEIDRECVRRQAEFNSFVRKCQEDKERRLREVAEARASFIEKYGVDPLRDPAYPPPIPDRYPSNISEVR